MARPRARSAAVDHRPGAAPGRAHPAAGGRAAAARPATGSVCDRRVRHRRSPGRGGVRGSGAVDDASRRTALGGLRRRTRAQCRLVGAVPAGEPAGGPDGWPRWDWEWEQRVVDGHPFHPNCRSRPGFSVAEQLAYGPSTGRSWSWGWYRYRPTAVW
ncbi:IucA/IucC family protein [Streptomyces sp. INA 01156]